MRDLPESIRSKYRFITITAKRCSMLQKGARPKIDASNITKFTTLAMEEVLDDVIKYEITDTIPLDDYQMTSDNSPQDSVEKPAGAEGAEEIESDPLL